MGDLYIKNGHLVGKECVSSADIYIHDGKIMYVGDASNAPAKSKVCPVINATGLYIFPGFIDAHTHYGVGSGASASIDDFYTGTKAAAFGGITTVVDFADHLPCTRLLEGTLARIDEAKESVIDYALHQGIYWFHDTIEEEIAELATFGVSILKVFTTYKELGLYLDSAYWDRLFALCKKYSMLVTVHAESQRIIDDIATQYADQNELSPDYQTVLRPSDAEAEAIQAIGDIARKHKVPLYIVHVSSDSGMKAIRLLRKSMSVYAETTPHYLLLNSELLSREDGKLYIINPPLRTPMDNKALVHAVSKNEIGIIATDHCAYSRMQKMNTGDCRNALAGIPGSETLAALIYTYLVKTGYLDLSGMRKLLCDNPAQVFGLYPRKGSFEIGSDADIVVCRETVPHKISVSDLHGGADYSPYEGMEISFEHVYTISGGKIIVDHGKFYGKAGDGSFIQSNISSLFTL